MGARRRMIQDARISARREAPPRGLSPSASPSHPRAAAWGTRRAAGATPAPQTCSFPSCGRSGRGDDARAPSLQRHRARLSWATEENGGLAIPADAPAPSPRQAGGGRDPSITLDNARVARGSCGRHGPHATAPLCRPGLLQQAPQGIAAAAPRRPTPPRRARPPCGPRCVRTGRRHGARRPGSPWRPTRRPCRRWRARSRTARR